MGNRLGLDPDKFQHVSSDKDKTVLQHKDGHQLVIAHNVLSPKMREQLLALAKKPDDKDEEKKSKYGKVIIKDDPPRNEKKKENPTDAVNEEPQMYAEGDMVEQQPIEEAAQMDPSLQRKREIYNLISNVTPGEKPHAGSEAAFGPNGEEPKQFNPQSWAQAELNYSKEKENNAANTAKAQQEAIGLNEQRVAAGLQPIPVPNVPEGPQIPGSQPNEVAPTDSQSGAQLGLASATAQPQQQPQHDMSPMDSMEDMLQTGINNRIAGLNAQAAAQGQLGQAQAKLIDDNLRAKTDAQAHYQQEFDRLTKESKDFVDDLKNAKVDPNKYWTGDANGNGGHSKISSAIGMILAGFNPTSNPNAAVNMLKFQMEQNLNAQKENLGTKKSLLEANIRHMGNLRDGMEMTRLMQNDLMQSELAKAAANAQSPLAASATQQAIGQLQIDAAPRREELAMKRAMINLARSENGDPRSIDHMLGMLRVTNPAAAKEMESRFVPGVGLGSIPVPEKVREEMVSHQKLQNAAQDVLAYSKKHSNLIPGTAAHNEGVQKSMILQQMVREGLLGTVFRESEKPLLEKFVDENPAGAFKSISTQPKLKTIIESNAQQLNILKSNYGLKTQATPQQQQSPQSALQWAKANPKDPRAAEILKRLGQ